MDGRAELRILPFADFFSPPLLLLLSRCMIVIIIEIPGGAARRSTRLEFLLPTIQGGPVSSMQLSLLATWLA